MESYKLLENHYKLKIIKTTSQENKTIEMDTKSQFFQDLFFTKKEKTNNNIYDIILGITILIIIIFFPILVILLLTEKLASSSIISGCSSIFILIGIIIIITPIIMTLERLLVTKINNIKLIFSSNGLDIIPDKDDKNPIFIETLNIAEICIKESEIEDIDGRGSYKKRILNMILKFHKAITNPITNKDIKEIILIEDIEKDYLKQTIFFAEDIKQALGL